ncbi:MAG: hypothetical protein CVU56_15815 [Deltaproteobacteria bacterium HGW-Deltaproteobacteria-14]|jgi:hypothetical protein|nr:MAG: hypothetical protein CVU56_15815 [Deltaproteobacteria bacterium HGW-Deltaproteobacteria-14]
MKPADIFDREAEWATLEAMWRKRGPQLAFVLGRRRIGKSHLLSRFARHVDGLYYQATRRTETEQLVQLSRLLATRFDDPGLRHGAGFASWEALLAYVTERAQGAPFLLVLDEFPYLASASPALTSIIQRCWDHDWPQSRVRLVLSGSYVTAMKALEGADQPLYGRRTLHLGVGPFDFADATAFMPRHTPWDRLVAYAVFGHLPGHLARIDPDSPIAANAAGALLDPSGPLVDDAQHMLDAFLNDARVPYSILEAIALGDHTWTGITRRVGLSGGALLRPLQWLEEMGLVARVVPLTERNPSRSKRAVYRVTDPYVAFWHRTVGPLHQAGTIGLVAPERLWTEVVSPRLSEHLGPVFEEVCRQFVRRAERLPIRPVRVGEWWDVRSEHQLDIAAIDAEGRLFAAECKLGGVTREDLTTLRLRAGLLQREMGASVAHLAFFSARDQADDGVRSAVAAGEVSWFTLEDL